MAGTLHLAQACILFGWHIPLVISAGLLGRQAIHGGVGTYILGVCLNFFIACSAAAIYYAASRPLRFMTEHPLVCGLFFGRSRRGNDPRRFAALRASRRGPLQASRPDSWAACAHGCGRAPDFLQCSAVREIAATALFAKTQRRMNNEDKPNGIPAGAYPTEIPRMDYLRRRPALLCCWIAFYCPSDALEQSKSR